MKHYRFQIFLSAFSVFIFACNAITGGGTQSQPNLQATLAAVTPNTVVNTVAPQATSAAIIPSDGIVPTATKTSDEVCNGDPECLRIDALVASNQRMARPIRVSTDAPSCPQPAKGQACGVWSTGNHAYVTYFVNNWSPSAEFKDSSPIDAGSLITFDHSDGTYAYVIDSWGQHVTFKLAEVTFTAPTSNVPGKNVYYFTQPITVDWGPYYRNDTQPGTYPCYSYGLSIQYSEYQYVENADDYIATGQMAPIAGSIFVGKDDFTNCTVLKIIPTNESGTEGGAWVMIDGQKLFSRYIYFNYWPDHWWARNHIEPPQ